MYYNIDIVDACNCKCKTCWRGQGQMVNTKQHMPLDMFESIINKIVSVSNNVSMIGLYNWTEPFLHPQLAEFVAVCKNNNLLSAVSTNLSLSGIDIASVLDAGLHNLIISLTGLSQEVHEINYSGSNMKTIRANMEYISKYIKSKNLTTKVDVRFIEFSYNKEQLSEVRDYAQYLGFGFHVLKGTGDPIVGVISNFTMANLSNFNYKNTECFNDKTCSLVFDRMAIDCKGDVYLCCARPNINTLKIGNFLNISLKEITLRKFMHPQCAMCNILRRNIEPNDIDMLQEALNERRIFGNLFASLNTRPTNSL